MLNSDLLDLYLEEGKLNWLGEGQAATAETQQFSAISGTAPLPLRALGRVAQVGEAEDTPPAVGSLRSPGSLHPGGDPPAGLRVSGLVLAGRREPVSPPVLVTPAAV